MELKTGLEFCFRWGSQKLEPKIGILNQDKDKDWIMLLKGCLAKLMVQVDAHLYRKYIINNKKNQTLLYVKLTKAIYSLLKSALLFYTKSINGLKSYSSPFATNQYNFCVANATVGNKQVVVNWYVDDLKESHIAPSRLLSLQPILPQYMAMASSSTTD